MLRRTATLRRNMGSGCNPRVPGPKLAALSSAGKEGFDMLIGQVLKAKGTQVISVRAGDGIASITRTLAQHRIGAVLVVEGDGTVLGIVSERDIVRALAGMGEAVMRMTAGQLMTRVLFTVTPASLVQDALQLMTDRRVRHLPVLNPDGTLAGMVSIGDLVKARIAEAEQEAEELKAYVATAG
ncbi:CBS domain-containing protein [Rubritepida flocculans]|uniref:CBS domain-containing protein n=1 Tax=Rubritepida flocculans TaxID=182403 RepID=UPI000419D29A|nr:CBS domain-containing protein [Rubritepida flocculans]